jgi:hypothetical protein
VVFQNCGTRSRQTLNFTKEDMIMETSTSVSGRQSFLQVWVKAITKPSESTYADLASSPGAKANTAFLWIFLCTFAPAFVNVLVSGGQISQRLQDAGVDVGEAGGGLGASLVSFLCLTPVAAVVGVVGFIISVAIMQWIARMFRGQGTFDQLAYTLGAISAPGLLVSAVLTLPSLIPYVGMCSGILSGLLGIYLIVLEVMAIKGVHRFGWGAAIGTLVIPGLAIALVACCIAFALASVLGLAMGDVFSTINQSLAQ